MLRGEKSAEMTLPAEEFSGKIADVRRVDLFGIDADGLDAGAYRVRKRVE